jgi:hypothetical protein
MPKKRQPNPTVAALGVLKALDPHSEQVNRRRSRSEEYLVLSDSHFREDKKEKKPFWDNIIRDKDKEKDRDKEKEREKWKSKDKERDRKDEGSPEELTKMIGTSRSIPFYPYHGRSLGRPSNS